MKIAFATDDHHTISPHLGRAQWYEVVTIEQGQVVAREQRAKQHHTHPEHTAHDDHHHRSHHWLVEPVADCAIIVARGMGNRRGMPFKLPVSRRCVPRCARLMKPYKPILPARWCMKPTGCIVVINGHLAYVK